VLTKENCFSNLTQTIKEKSKNIEHLEHTSFKALQRETTVFKYYVELKKDVFTEHGYLDLVKIPDLYLSGAGQFLRNLRNKYGLSQKKIAKILNVSHSLVSYWEGNQSRIPLKKLVKIAEILEISRDTIYSLIDRGKINTKHKLPVKFEKFCDIVQYLFPNKISHRKWPIGVIKCSKETISKIENTLNVKIFFTSKQHALIYSKDLHNFLTNFFLYNTVSKIRTPLTSEVRRWYERGIDLKRAVIIPCLQSDGGIVKCKYHYRIGFYGKNKILHDHFVDACAYEYNELPSTYFASYYRTEYYRKSANKITDEVMSLAGNVKTSPAQEQTVEEYLKEPQPQLDYLVKASDIEQQIALRIWASTEGFITVDKKKNMRVYPRLQIACAHPNLVTQLQQIARRFNIKFHIRRSKRSWSGIDALSTKAISSCINFLKLGGFIKGVKISSKSPYYEDIDKDVLLLGILEHKKRELENRHRKLSIQQIHYRINKLIENREYKSADYYINYFS
jgi:transcriptional regulator with XRE-family HTH domain